MVSSPTCTLTCFEDRRDTEVRCRQDGFDLLQLQDFRRFCEVLCEDLEHAIGITAYLSTSSSGLQNRFWWISITSIAVTCDTDSPTRSSEFRSLEVTDNTDSDEERAFCDLLESLTISTAAPIVTAASLDLTPPDAIVSIPTVVVTPFVVPTANTAAVVAGTAPPTDSSPGPRPPLPPPSPPMPPGRRRKYYVVTAGKCTGVFDNWLYVHSLTSGVSGSCQESFKTYDEALYLYTDAKRRGIVRLVRDPGDEEIFGPVEDAMQ